MGVNDHHYIIRTTHLNGHDTYRVWSVDEDYDGFPVGSITWDLDEARRVLAQCEERMRQL